MNVGYGMPHCRQVNPFTPESDQCQNSPAASQEIWHHTVWRTWLFITYSDEKWLYYKFSLHHSYNRFLKGWENTLFELRSERVNLWHGILKTDQNSKKNNYDTIRARWKINVQLVLGASCDLGPLGQSLFLLDRILFFCALPHCEQQKAIVF